MNDTMSLELGSSGQKQVAQMGSSEHKRTADFKPVSEQVIGTINFISHTKPQNRD